MGIVIHFTDFKRGNSSARAHQAAKTRLDEKALADAMSAAIDQASVLKAAHPLLVRCRDRYGFIVMQNGLPQEPAILSRALMQLYRGLSMLDAAMAAPRTYPIFGVYFGHRRLSWFEDGHSGATALAAPNDVGAEELAVFLQPRIVAGRSHTRQ